MNVTVLGSGRWASFHAWYQSEILKNDVLMYGRENCPLLRELMAKHRNQYVTLNNRVKFTSDLAAAINFSKYIIIAISAQGMPEFSAEIAKTKPADKTFVLCMKGIIAPNGERLTEVLSRHIDASNHLTVWAGPGHVQEFVAGQPNIMVIDGTDPETVADVAEKFHSRLIRLYQGDDLIGTEIGAAAKNVMGIMAGMLDSVNRGSLKGALMARGAHEVARLIVAMGGKLLTAYGICHLGDYEATLFSKNSNNRRFGEEFMRDREKHIKRDHDLAEGVASAKSFYNLAKKYNVDMPISNICYKILYENADPQKSFDDLIARTNVKEFRFDR